MNKELLNQLPADEQLVASKLDSLVEDMQVSPAFQWDLETRLMDTAKKKSRPRLSWYTKIMPTLGWGILALGAVFLLNGMLRALLPNLQAAEPVATQEISFAAQDRAGNICTGRLALAHGFAVFLTNEDKTGFVMFDEERTIDEIRSFAWSPDGRELALFGNTTGRGNIYLTDSAGDPLRPLLPNSELGYLRDAAWSRDEKQFILWSSQNNSMVYLVNADGSGLVERPLDVQIFSTPQLAPDHESIIFYGADLSLADGLLEAMLDGSDTRMISDLVEDESGFAFSPDGSRLAYIEMNRDLGEARLVADEMATGSKVVLGTLPIPKGSGSSIPESANLSWSHDGKSLVFEFGRSPADRAVYLAYADGTGLVKVADAAHAPAISADGKCLAYISDQQVFLMDLTKVSATSGPNTVVLLADLPAGRSIADFRLDKLQWRPGKTP